MSIAAKQVRQGMAIAVRNQTNDNTHYETIKKVQHRGHQVILTTVEDRTMEIDENLTLSTPESH